jgi:hypothetical protein
MNIFMSRQNFHFWSIPRQLLTVAAITMAAGSAAAQTSLKVGKAVSATQIVEAFADASDRADANALDAILHPGFRVVFSMKAGSPPSTLDRTQYLKMVRDGKIGGKARKIELSGFDTVDGFASIAAKMTRPDAIFNGVYSLIEQDGRWQLLQEAVVMTVTEVKK